MKQAATSARGADQRSVPLRVERQQKSEWCWAAVSVSVNRLFRPESTHTQCEIVGSTLQHQCCGGADDPECNHPHTLHPVLGRLHLLVGEPHLKPLTFSKIKTEIDAGRPICVLIKWLDGKGQVTTRGHFITITGYRITPGQKQFVSISDPFFGESEVSYLEFSDASGGYRDGKGQWFASFLVADKA
jgi:hypothetical protein